MNKKNMILYNRIFENPIRSDIKWRDIESFFLSAGAVITEGRGSRIRVMLNGEMAVFHRPHPEGITDKGAVKAVRRFLNNAGVTK